MRLLTLVLSVFAASLGCGNPFLPQSDQNCQVPEDNLVVMSFNIRFGSDAYPNSWPLRQPLVYESVAESQADVLALQEAMYDPNALPPYTNVNLKVNDLLDEFPHYNVVPETSQVGIYADYILYDSTRLVPLDYEVITVTDPRPAHH